MPLAGGAIPAFAWGGLAAGLAFCAVFGRKIARRFYSARTSTVLAVYFCCTAVAFAFAMGVPVLVPVPGIVFGFYMGRRIAHAGARPEEAKHLARLSALLAAGMTGLFCLGSLTMAILDKSLAGNISRMLGMELGRKDILTVAALLLPIMVWVQYLLTRWAVWIARRT